MAYTKQTWHNLDPATALSDDRLSHLETQYDEAVAFAAPGGAYIKAGSTDAGIRAAVAAVVAAGGGIVALPPATITLSAPLPYKQSVRYVGVPPVQAQASVAPGPYLADSAPTFVGGTILVGDGTFACFEANEVDAAAPSATFGADQIANAGIYGVGIDNFTYGIRVGAKNVMGAVWGSLDQIYIKNCSAWGVKLANFVHMDIGLISTYLCQNGQYFGAQMDGTVYQGGNTVFRELFDLLPQDARDRRLHRGIVFEAMGGTSGNGGAMNEIQVHRAQMNSYNRVLLTVAATFTSGSTTVAVPDGTKFLPGMVVSFAATNYGFTIGQAYVVQTVSGNNLTIGGSRTGSAISATGSGSTNLNTYGFPAVEITAADSLSHVTSSFINHVDAEGNSAAAIYIEGAQRCEFGISSSPNATTVDVIGRNVTYSRIKSAPPVVTDFDANSTSSEFHGARKGSYQRPLRGQYYDTILGVQVIQLYGGNNGQTGGDIQSRSGGFIYPASGMGERIFPRDSALTLGGANVGDVVFAGSASQTFTLPTIATDTSSPAGSQVGAVFDIYNVGSGTITVNTDGTQLMNKITGRTTTTIIPGNKLKLVGAKDNSGNLFWLAVPGALLA